MEMGKMNMTYKINNGNADVVTSENSGKFKLMIDQLIFVCADLVGRLIYSLSPPPYSGCQSRTGSLNLKAVLSNWFEFASCPKRHASP